MTGHVVDFRDGYHEQAGRGLQLAGEVAHCVAGNWLSAAASEALRARPYVVEVCEVVVRVERASAVDDEFGDREGLRRRPICLWRWIVPRGDQRISCGIG